MNEIEEIIFNEQAIGKKVRELAARISGDYAGRDLVLVCVLKGAVVFMSDLMRRLSIPVTVDFIRARSYGPSAEPSKRIIIEKDIETDIQGKDVLFVDCIIDTGGTLACLFKRYAGRGMASLKAVVLLDKKSKRSVEVPLAYIGYEIPDRFVVGYGLDYAERYRCLPYIAALNF